MAKNELFNKKSLSMVLAKIAGMVPVDRSGFANGAFAAVRDKLKENWGVLIHPEGTRSNDGEIAVFKKGAALLSIEANVPIVPAYIDGGYEIYPKSNKLPNLFNWKKMRKYKVKIRYGEPIFPKNYNADELIKVVE
jgi:1-acyl-sn-glycerol-3-phosphate acyltransferase